MHNEKRVSHFTSFVISVIRDKELVSGGDAPSAPLKGENKSTEILIVLGWRENRLDGILVTENSLLTLSSDTPPTCSDYPSCLYAKKKLSLHTPYKNTQYFLKYRVIENPECDCGNKLNNLLVVSSYKLHDQNEIFFLFLTKVQLDEFLRQHL